jgi:hypothetical protein
MAKKRNCMELQERLVGFRVERELTSSPSSIIIKLTDHNQRITHNQN